MKVFRPQHIYIMVILLAGFGCTQTTQETLPEVSVDTIVPVKVPEEVYKGPMIVVPLTEQQPLKEVLARYEAAGITVDTVIPVPNSNVGKVLKAQEGSRRVREGDSVRQHATLRLWVGEAK